MNAHNNFYNCDFVVIGAGIIGLTIAFELINKYPDAKIIILEKENKIGKHASGRNSGVLHAGIYYKENTLKAKLCLEGHRLLKQYCLDNNLPLDQCGKVVVCPTTKHKPSLDIIYNRALKNNVKVELINKHQLKELEPHARTATEQALWVPSTAVFDPVAILNNLLNDLEKLNVNILYNTNIIDLDAQNNKITAYSDTYTANPIQISYGHLLNTAGLHADQIASKFNINNYTILPFKGLYYYLSQDVDLKLNKLIYPVPDIDLPFLGIHATKNINGNLSIGPSALPALSRENYTGMNNIKFNELIKISSILLKQYYLNKNNFRKFAHLELMNFFNKNKYINTIKQIMPELDPKYISNKIKVGIRAQLIDLDKQELVMDLLVKRAKDSTHVLNAVSPAFTCSFALAKHIVESIKK